MQLPSWMPFLQALFCTSEIFHHRYPALNLDIHNPWRIELQQFSLVEYPKNLVTFCLQMPKPTSVTLKGMSEANDNPVPDISLRKLLNLFSEFQGQKLWCSTKNLVATLKPSLSCKLSKTICTHSDFASQRTMNLKKLTRSNTHPSSWNGIRGDSRTNLGYEFRSKSYGGHNTITPASDTMCHNLFAHIQISPSNAPTISISKCYQKQMKTHFLKWNLMKQFGSKKLWCSPKIWLLH